MPIARTNDPSTSHRAAASVGGLSESHARILALYHYSGPMTDGDLLDLYQQMTDAGDYPPLSVSGIRTRRSELIMQGRLEDTGRRGETVSGRACIIFGLPA